ncbi:ROK family protein [Alicyclobacillaceae bacterium I2511]|nr:ROK family protein [Alicyclobacillaceae bacterium I2511]
MLNIIGIDIGGTKCIVSLAEWVDNKLQFKKVQRFLTMPQRGPEAILGHIESIVKDMMKVEANIAAIGISCGGPLDSLKGIIMSPPNLPGWESVRIVERMAARFDIPIYLENDANADALAEWLFGAGRGANNLVFMTFGTGLGAGLIMNGHLYTGAHGMAGELGHWRLSEEFGPINYGKTGSFQGYCSGNGIVMWYHHLLGQQDAMLTAEEIAILARKGDELAQRVYRQSGEVLGQGLALLIDLLAPDIIIIGGIFSYSYDLIGTYVEKVIDNESLKVLRQSCTIKPSVLGQDIGNYAGCIVAVNKILEIKNDF